MENPNSWLDIDLNTLSNNISAIKKYIGNTRFLAVVKANAYGYGIIPVAKCAVESGADFLGVSSLEEGIFLRQNGIKAPILVFNTILPEQAEDALRYDLTITICSFDVVQALNDVAFKMNKRAYIHIKVDTGLGRFGVLPDNTIELIKIIKTNFKHVYIEGIYTHFSSATNKRVTYKQFSIFKSIIEQLEALGYYIPLKHVCNSSATLNYPDMHMDMVRVGNLMYGLCPVKDLNIKDPARIYSKIVFLKNLPKGHYVGYGNKYKTRRNTTIAIIPFGFYDGLELMISQPNGIWDAFKSFIKQILASFGIVGLTRKVKINGQYCNILGKISMQNCIIDITDLKGEVFVGDTVEISARKVNLSASLARVYHSDNKVLLEQENPLTKSNADKVPKCKQRGETSIG